MGSGGGYGGTSSARGGAGGGAVKLNVSQTLTVNGSISANGANGGASSLSYTGGGGSGGSIYITAGTLTGSGSLAANGGNGGNSGGADGGGGGGGRIAVYYTTDSSSISYQAYGGSGPGSAQEGGAGTVYLKDNVASRGSFTVENTGIVGARTLYAAGIADINDINITNGANLDFNGVDINVYGNFNCDNGQLVAGTTTTTFLGGGSQTIKSGGEALYHVLINNAGGSWQLQDAFDVDGTFRLQAGSFDANGQNQNYAGNFTLDSGVTYIKGGTVTFDGDLSFSDSAGQNMGTVVVGNSPDTTTLTTDLYADSLTINSGDSLITDGYEITLTDFVNINGGTLDASDGTDNYTIISVAGNWSNTGSFVAGYSEVHFTNPAKITTISDDTTFNDLICTVANKTILVAGNSTQTISGSLDLDGQTTGTEIILNSTNTNRFTFDVTGGEQIVDYIDVSYANASSHNIYAQSSVNSGNNDDAEAGPHWVFNAPNPPTDLLVNDLTNPVTLSDTTPDFKATYTDPEAGDIANYYQIQVDDNSDFSSIYWDSGKTSMSNCLAGSVCGPFTYNGPSLVRNTTYYWRVKYWDDGGNEGPYSQETAYFKLAFVTIDSITFEDSGSNIIDLFNPAILTPGSTTTYYVRGQITDDFGCDTTVLDSVVYRSGVGGGTACVQDNNDCYDHTKVSCSMISCVDTVGDYECTVALEYYADPTVAGSVYAGEYWGAYLEATHGTASDNDQTDFEIDELVSFEVGNIIDYSSLQLGEVSADIEIVVENLGNVAIDYYVNGTSMSCDLGSITPDRQHYSLTDNFTYESGTDLTSENVLVPANIPQRTDDLNPSVKSLFWRLQVEQGARGGCNGINGFILTKH